MLDDGSREDLGIVLLLLSLVCLGTWPALLRLASEAQQSTSSQQLQHQLQPDGEEEKEESSVFYASSDGYSSLPATTATGQPLATLGTLSSDNHNPQEPTVNLRVVCHAYLDYATTYFVVSSIPFFLAALLSASNETSDIFTLPPLPLIAVAMLGGTLLSFGNLSFQWATAVYKASLTFVLAIQASMTIVLGTGVNYWLQPGKTKRPHWLLAGMTCFLLAIAMAVQSQLAWMQQKEERAALVDDDEEDEQEEIEMHYQPDHERAQQLASQQSSPTKDNNIVIASFTISPHLVDTSKAATAPSPVVTGLFVAVLGGLCFGFFSPAFNVAVNDPFQWTNNTDNMPQSDGDDNNQALRVVRANLIFSFAFWQASFVGNLWLLRQQQDQTCSIPTLLRRYLQFSSLSDRRLALGAGLVCAMGNVLQFQGGQLVGYATADLVQAYPIVSTVWDVVCFGEFRSLRCPSRLATMLLGMYLAYGTGVLLFAGSSVR